MVDWAKEAFSIGEKTDEQIVEQSEATETQIATLSGSDWRSVPTRSRVTLLEAAEHGGADGVEAALA